MKPINAQISPVFVKQARKLAKIERILQQILPPECQQHVRLGNIRQQSLMLITDSPVWTTRLRQLSPQILSFMQQHMPTGEKLHHVQISTRYQQSAAAQKTAVSKRSPAHRQMVISDKSARLLRQSADSIQDQALKKSLLKLARHTRRSLSNKESNDPAELSDLKSRR